MKARTRLSGLEEFPMFWMALAFATGILTSQFLQSGWRTPLVFCVGSLVSALILRRPRTRLAVLFATSLFAGWAEHSWRGVVPDSRVSKLIDRQIISEGDPVELTGEILKLPEPAVGGFFLDVSVVALVQRGIDHQATGAIRLFAVARDEDHLRAFEELDLGPGTRVAASFRINRSERFVNPGVPKYLEILEQKGVDATGTIKSPLLVTVIERNTSVSPLYFASYARNWLVREFGRLLEQGTAGVMIASLLGDKYFLDRRTAELFREGGTFHVLVISGLHITFIGGVILWATSLLTRGLWLQFITSSAVLWLFALSVGGEVPVVRAAVMFTVLLFLRALNRDASSLNAFGLSALVVLAWRPMDLYSPSFILTFVCTGAIVSMAIPIVSNLRASGRWIPSKRTPLPPNIGRGLRRFCETLYWRDAEWEFANRRQAWSAVIFKRPMFKRAPFLFRRVTAYLFEALLVSLIVQVCLLPFQIWYFHRVSTGGLILNLWVEAVMVAETFTAVLTVAVAQISETLSLPLSRLTEVLNQYLLYPHSLLREGGFASVRLPVYGFMGVLTCIYLLALVFLASRIIRWNPFQWDSTAERGGSDRLLSASAAMILSMMIPLLVFHPLSAPSASGTLRIDFLDVGQGDSMLVTFPNGETMLVDGGGRASFGSDARQEDFEPDIRSIGEAVVSEFLWEKGYSRIDYVLATHADTDHMQGLADVVRNFKVEHVYLARLATDDPEFRVLSEEMSRRGLSPELVARGDRFEIAGVSIDILNPRYSGQSGVAYGNEQSIVLSLRYGTRRFLLTGDVEREGEREMLVRPESLRADVVKVAHHGSRTSSTEDFVRAVQPSYAVISVGKSSPFGHPHEEVVDRWIRSGARVLTTGNSGTVTVETDGKSLAVRTFSEGD